MKRTATSLLSISLLSAALLACGGDDDNTTVNGNADASTGTTTRDASIDAATGSGSAADAALDATVSELTDAQIAGVVSTVNMGEVMAGDFAATMAQSAGAKDYASMMVTMHTAAQNDLTTLLQTLGLTQADSAVSDMLMTTATTMLQQLKSMSAGPAFDKAYASGQATMHQTVLNIIDSQLLPQVQSAPLKASLQTTRALVQSHLDGAKALLATLQTDAG